MVHLPLHDFIATRLTCVSQSGYSLFLLSTQQCLDFSETNPTRIIFQMVLFCCGKHRLGSRWVPLNWSHPVSFLMMRPDPWSTDFCEKGNECLAKIRCDRYFSSLGGMFQRSSVHPFLMFCFYSKHWNQQ